MSTKHAEDFEILVLGAGISGIGAGIRLLERGMTDFAILEKADDLGGTWRDNTYPGLTCDVPSTLYSYSFAQKHDWSRVFAGQREILEYVRETAEARSVPDHIRFNQEVRRAQWIDAEKHWRVETADTVYRARFLITCTGYLHEPSIPDLPGLKDFPGKVFHSSRWDHEHDLNGERVAVIGTGASAIQFVPAIQPEVSELHIFQRSPQWVLPKPDHEIPSLEKAFFRLPFTLNMWRQMVYGGFETFGIGFRRPALLRQFQKVGEAHLRRAVPDPELRAKLTPDYTLGCKRVLMSNDYYPALNQPNVDLLATGVKEVRGNTVIGADGSEREVDTIILGTGFHVTEQPIAQRVFDGAGRSLSAHWAEGMQAYKGTTIHGFPNAFMVLGPNLGIGHNSAFIVIEAQLDYIMDAIGKARRKDIVRLEVTADTQRRHNRRIQRDLQGSVWNTGGCSSYYLDKNGFNSVGFPWSTLAMRRMLKRFDLRNYQATGRRRDAEQAEAA